jgi:DNA-binding NarL/FixJ family response regulator
MNQARDRSGPAESGPWRVAIVEDHLLQRRRTEELLAADGNLRVVCSCETLPRLLQWLKAASPGDRPHLLVLDLCVDRGPSVDPRAIAALVESGIRILVLSALASVTLVQAAVRAGVSGILAKQDSEDDILDAVRTVLHNGQWMTPELASIIAGDVTRPRLSGQEERALILYASGLTLQAVATALGVKRDTAKQYLDRAKSKYTAAGRPVHTKADMVRVAINDGYLQSGAV